MKKKIYIMIFLAVAFLYQLLFSVSTTPLFFDCYIDVNGVDGADALAVAKAALEGILPYRDLYTTAGPSVYLFTIAGYALAGRTGVWILQGLGMWLFLLFMWKTIRRNLSVRTGILLTGIIMVVFIALLGGGGGYVEWTLPFAMWILYYTTSETNRTGADLFTGICLIFLIGIHVLPGLLGLFAILCSGKWKRKILWIGAGIPLLCFVLYMGLTGSFGGWSEVVTGYLLPASVGEMGTITEVVKRIIKAAPGSVLLFAAFSERKNRKIRNMLVISAIILLLLFVTGDGAWMKYAVLSCYFPFCFSMLWKKRKKRKYMLLSVLATASCLVYVFPLRYFAAEYRDYCLSGSYREEAEFFHQWKEDYAADQTELFAIEISPRYYLLTDMVPVFRYYQNQSEIGSYNETAAYDIYDYIWDDGYKGETLLSTGRGGIYEMLGNYLWVDLYNQSEPVALYLWQDETENTEAE